MQLYTIKNILWINSFILCNYTLQPFTQCIFNCEVYTEHFLFMYMATQVNKLPDSVETCCHMCLTWMTPPAGASRLGVVLGVRTYSCVDTVYPRNQENVTKVS